MLKCNSFGIALLLLMMGASHHCGAASRRAEGARQDRKGDLLAVQVFLDNANFGLGEIDGQGGEFTRKAIALYEKAHGHPPGGSQSASALVLYSVTASDAERIGAAPKKPAEQAKQKWLPYASVIELLAEKFHTSQEYLRKLNPQLRGRDARAGDSLRVPNVKPFEIAQVEARQTGKESPSASEREGGDWIEVNVGEKNS